MSLASGRHRPLANRRNRECRHSLAIVLGTLAVAALGDRPTPVPRDLSLAPAATTPERALVTSPSGDPARCAQVWPARVAVRGRLQQEVDAGPPGYGETPRQDRRDTLLVLVLPAPLAVCVDSVDRPDRPAVVQVSRIQLGRSPVRAPIGTVVIVYGALAPRTWGGHRTPVVLEVDSIPGPRLPHGDRDRTS